MLPRQDNANAFAPAITALRLELADLERRAAEARALINGLCAHAGITYLAVGAGITSNTTIASACRPLTTRRKGGKWNRKTISPTKSP